MPQELIFNALKSFQYIFLILLISSLPVHLHADEDALNNIQQKLMEANSLKLQADYILTNTNESLSQQHVHAYALLYRSHTLKQQVYASMLSQLIHQNTNENSFADVSATILSNADRLIKSSTSIVTKIETQSLETPAKIENYQQACHDLSLATVGYQMLYDTFKNNESDSCLNAYKTKQQYDALSLKYNQSINAMSSLFAEADTPKAPTTPSLEPATPTPAPSFENNTNTESQLVFTIQLAASKGPLNPDILAHFQKKTNGNLQEVIEGEWYKYQYIVGSSYQETHQMWLQFGSDVCFPVAYYNGKKISMQKALALCANK